MKKSSYKIVYDLPDLPWLSDPPVNKGLRAPTQQGEDSFGLWHSSTKRPASDRIFNPKDKTNPSVYEAPKGRPKLTCPQSECAISHSAAFLYLKLKKITASGCKLFLFQFFALISNLDSDLQHFFPKWNFHVCST